MRCPSVDGCLCWSWTPSRASRRCARGTAGARRPGDRARPSTACWPCPGPRIDASQDWHPPDHCSFLGQRDNLYPPHCVPGHARGRVPAGPAHRALPRHLAQGLRARLRGLRRDRPAPRLPGACCERAGIDDGGGVRPGDEHLLLLRRPRPAPGRLPRAAGRGRQRRHRRARRRAVPGRGRGRRAWRRGSSM